MNLPYELTDLLRLAYSAEKAAAFAYQGHSGAIKDPDDKIRIREIENDEWIHRAEVLNLMQQYKIPVSWWYEVKYYIIGKLHQANHKCNLTIWTRRAGDLPSELPETFDAWTRPFNLFLRSLRPASQ